VVLAVKDRGGSWGGGRLTGKTMYLREGTRTVHMSENLAAGDMLRGEMVGNQTVNLEKGGEDCQPAGSFRLARKIR